MTRPNFSHASEEMASYEIPGKVRVTIGWIGEGWQGDFDEEDPKDDPLLRFDAHDLTYPEANVKTRSWQDSSYCTQLPAWVPLEVLQSVCRAIAEAVVDETHWKRVLENWSWIDEKKARTIHAKYERRQIV